MKLPHLTVALSAGALLMGCSLVEQPISANAPPQSSPSSSPTEVSTEPDTGLGKVTAARRLAWDAAVMVQSPPHPVDTWQQARVKWRQAIDLLEAVPSDSALAAEVKQRLAVYRVNYAAINNRLKAEQTASERLRDAQTLAWQAAVTVQKPPHPLRVWQRAQQKWQDAIALLETVPNTTLAFAQSQEKLTTYRGNLAAIKQRVVTETSALMLLKQFSETAVKLNNLPNNALAGLTTEQVGISYQDYIDLVRDLETSLQNFANQPDAQKHPIYQDMVEVVADHKLVLRLWQSYLAYKDANSEWLYGDFYNQLFPVSLEDGTMLAQKYGVKTYPYANGTKISLRFTAWGVWQQASQRVKRLQQTLLSMR